VWVQRNTFDRSYNAHVLLYDDDDAVSRGRGREQAPRVSVEPVGPSFRRQPVCRNTRVGNHEPLHPSGDQGGNGKLVLLDRLVRGSRLRTAMSSPAQTPPTQGSRSCELHRPLSTVGSRRPLNSIAPTRGLNSNTVRRRSRRRRRGFSKALGRRTIGSQRARRSRVGLGSRSGNRSRPARAALPQVSTFKPNC
jgi:hypothetical protein